jgi:DNA-directed RNA polymerase specialized sigma24 family protein
MMNPPMANDRAQRERAVIERFLESPDEESFADLFRVFTPQLVAFFRSRGCERALSEDLTQEIMLTVYRKAAQIRDRFAFSRLAIHDCAQCPLQAVREAMA